MFITIIADSKRHDLAAERLTQDGHTVTIYRDFDSLPQLIEGDIVILPIPSFTNIGILNLKGTPNTVNKEIFFNRISSDSFIICCNSIPEGRRYIDINRYEPFVSMNAVPSAEGAIALAMENSDITLFKSRALVIGYGRIGKLIAERLKGFFSSVTVTARKEKDRFAAESQGFKSIDFCDLDQTLGEFDFIFQTVPYPVLNRERIDLINGLLIEISSKGLGTDMTWAKEKGINFIYAPGIPEKYSNKSAGIILYDSIKSIISNFNEEFT